MVKTLKFVILLIHFKTFNEIILIDNIYLNNKNFAALNFFIYLKSEIKLFQIIRI
jgi:hypothetical protein